MRTVETTKVDVAPFELRVPEPFNVQPNFIVALPAKHKALIYNTTEEVRDFSKPTDQRGHYAVKEVPAWRMVIVNRQGLPTTRSSYQTQTDHVHTNPVSIQYQLKAWAQCLSKTKRTNVREDDPDADE
jgi:hypothetical protein